MVQVPAGIFPLGDVLKPTYLVSYAISRYPVTNLQYAGFVGETGHPPPEHWPGGRMPEGLDLHPVVGVSFLDARAYARHRGLDLPTDMQWEKAARGPEGRAYPWGMAYDPARCNSFSAGIHHTTPVDAYAGGASPYGCVDMGGNVWEWVDSQVVEGHQGRCGGSFLNYGITDCRCAVRSYFPLDQTSAFCGFRCVRLPTPDGP